MSASLRAPCGQSSLDDAASEQTKLIKTHVIARVPYDKKHTLTGCLVVTRPEHIPYIVKADDVIAAVAKGNDNIVHQMSSVLRFRVLR